MKRPIFSRDLIYHIYNRGVDKRNIFLDTDDYFRFIHNLYEFNDIEPAQNIFYKQSSYKSYEVGLRKMRKNVVEILAYVLMPNHYHIMIRQIEDKGVTEFMRKIGAGYTNYFNCKYERSGVLFQGKFKAVQLEHDAHFKYLPYYIHLNPLDLFAPEWRQGTLTDAVKTEEYLNSYRWSSHLDYAGTHNFPSVLHQGFLQDAFGGTERYKKDFISYIQKMNKIEDVVTDAFLE